MEKPNQPPTVPLTPEELKKVLERKARAEQGKVKVQREEYIIAEFGYYFGWAGVEAIVYNQITLKDALTLLEGARKVWSGKLLDIASVMYTASAASQSGKKAKQVMRKGLAQIIKEAHVDV